MAILASGSGYYRAANNNALHLSDKELGIGDYREQAHNTGPRLNDEELGIGAYQEHA